MVAQSRLPLVLLTRPALQSARFALQLGQEIGRLHLVQSPLLAPKFLQPVIGDADYAAVIFTSETAVVATRRLSFPTATLPQRAYCVGNRTALAAAEAGFEAISANGDSSALIALLLKSQQPGPLLHLRGQDTTGEVAQTLTKGGLVTHSVVIYAQEAQAFTQEAKGVLAGPTPVIVALFSPKTAAAMISQLQEIARAPLWLAALSGPVADAALPLKPAKREIAETPDADAMCRAIAKLTKAWPGP